MANGHGGRREGGGRKHGSRNKRTTAIEAYAKGVIEHPEVQKMTLQQAIEGTLPAPVVQMLYYYAYGKPVEHVEHSGDEDQPLRVIIRRA